MITDIREYCKLAERTSSTAGKDFYARLRHACDGFTTEVGEMVDVLKRHEQYGKPIDYVNLIEELGDWAWYFAEAMNATGVYQLCKDNIRDFCDYFQYLQHTDNSVSYDLPMFRTATDRLTMGLSGIVNLFHNQTSDELNAKDRASKCLGHMLEAWSMAVTALRADPADIFAKNITKLQARYPDKFTSECALNRDLNKERQVLEGKSTNAGS